MKAETKRKLAVSVLVAVGVLIGALFVVIAVTRPFAFFVGISIVPAGLFLAWCVITVTEPKS